MTRRDLVMWKLAPLVVLIFGMTMLASACGGGGQGRLAPTGTGKIAFTTTRDVNREVYVMNADGTRQTSLTNNPAEDAAPAWSPDGSKIAFVSDRDGKPQVYVMNADGTNQTNLTNNPTAGNVAPTWSPDGSKVAFVSYRDGNNEIYVMNADGSGQTNLTNNAAQDFPAVWSPDGSRIAFVSNRDGSDEIYVMNADGSGQANLTNSPETDRLPAWSPDGSKIAFVSYRDGDDEIYLMNADGSGQTNLTNKPGRDEHPVWSPDGSRIAFVSYRGEDVFDYDVMKDTDIYVMNADGTGQTRVAIGQTIVARDLDAGFHTAWSPDGSRIAFVSHRGDRDSDIYVVNADGFGQVRLTENPAWDWNPVWSPGP